MANCARSAVKCRIVRGFSMSFRLSSLLLVVLSAAGLVSCNRDPNVVKVKYLASGNKYYERGKFREARIMYGDALQKDLRYGPAHYRYGLVSLQLGDGVGAVKSFRRAIELIGPESQDHWDAMVKLTELYLALARDQKPYMDDVDRYPTAL